MKPKATALIIDDEQDAREVLANLLKKFPEIELIPDAKSVDEGIIRFLDYKPDIVFLDVQMPEKDGFVFIDKLQDNLMNTTIIFVTAYHKYAIDAIKHSAFDYLLKPINQKELKATLDRYWKVNNKNNLQADIQQLLNKLYINKRIKLNTRSGFELIKPEDILYVEADGRYTKIYCVLGKSTLSTLNLKKMEEILREYTYFVQINRSCFININYLSEFNRKNKMCLLFADSKMYKLPVSRDRIKNFERFL